MGRIRTIKPEFFRHELLQDLQRDNPVLMPMLVFAGLWTLCDKTGRFEWKPRLIKLDVLPFLDFNMEETLWLLAEHGLVECYEVEGKSYGWIPTFEDHQRISGKEAQSPSHFPGVEEGSIREAPEKHPRSDGDLPGVQEREKEGKGRERSSVEFPAASPAKARKPRPKAQGLGTEDTLILEAIWMHHPDRGEGRAKGARAATLPRVRDVMRGHDLTTTDVIEIEKEYHNHPNVKGGYVQATEVFWGKEGRWMDCWMVVCRKRKQEERHAVALAV